MPCVLQSATSSACLFSALASLLTPLATDLHPHAAAVPGTPVHRAAYAWTLLPAFAAQQLPGCLHTQCLSQVCSLGAPFCAPLSATLQNAESEAMQRRWIAGQTELVGLQNENGGLTQTLSRMRSEHTVLVQVRAVLVCLRTLALLLLPLDGRLVVWRRL